MKTPVLAKGYKSVVDCGAFAPLFCVKSTGF